MKSIRVISGIFVLVLLITISGALADSMTRGFFSGVSFSRLKMELPDGGTKSFMVTKDTQYIKYGKATQISELSKLLPGSIIQVSEKDGDAMQILVVEVPK